GTVVQKFFFDQIHCTLSLWSLVSKSVRSGANGKSLNRCFLLNHPTSLFPFNEPVELISPTKLCSCYAQKEQQYSEIMKFVDVTSQECGAPLVCYKLDDSGILEKIKDLPYPVAGTKCGENKSSAFRDKPHEIETIINKNAKPLSQHKCYQIKESKHGFPKDLQEQLRKIIFSEDLKSTLSEHV
ncbi:hypothetical protein PV325_007170, partial [Microctonus aethiopoides]